MIELSNVLLEVLEALGVDTTNTGGSRRAIDPGDHHRAPPVLEAGSA